MNANANNGPMLKAAGLWSKTSVKGGQYLTGRLGGVKVLILENRDRKTDDDPTHSLFFVEAPDRRQGGAERPQDRAEVRGGPETPRPLQVPSQARRGGFQGQGRRVPDHQAPLGRDGPPGAAVGAVDDVPEWAR
jgi:hypothetical protein